MKTHCPQKHEYTPENTYTDKNGYRHCKTCRRSRMKDRRKGGPGRGINNSAKTHCPRNHEYTPENTYVGKRGTRWCRTCMRANGVVQNLKRYGLTREDVERMLEEQEYRCAVCPRSLLEFTPHIDHDHACCAGNQKSCGKCVRGLLCAECNRMLGQARDEPSILRAGAAYLESRRLVLCVLLITCLPRSFTQLCGRTGLLPRVGIT